MKSSLVKDTKTHYRLKMLFDWLENAEENNNKWAVKVATKHILALSRKSYD